MVAHAPPSCARIVEQAVAPVGSRYTRKSISTRCTVSYGRWQRQKRHTAGRAPFGFHPSSRRSFLADLRADPAHRAEVLQGCLRRFEPRAAAAVACHCSSGPLEQREGKGKGFRPPKSRRCDTSHECNNHLIVHFEDKFKGSFFLFLFFFPLPKRRKEGCSKREFYQENFIARRYEEGFGCKWKRDTCFQRRTSKEEMFRNNSKRVNGHILYVYHVFLWYINSTRVILKGKEKGERKKKGGYYRRRLIEESYTRSW